MTDRRITKRFFRRAILAASLSCAVGPVSSAADPAPSREYPTTYSSRKAPWYDPLRVFTSAPKASDPQPTKVEVAPLPVPMTPPMSRESFRPVEIPTSPGPAMTVHNSAPAWKWYGYGTPSHNSFSNAPTGWHASSGATPGAVPLEPSLPNTIAVLPGELPKPTIPIVVAQPVRPETPVVVVPTGEGPKLPGTVIPPLTPPTFAIDWKSAPSASLRLPTNETPTVKPEGPSATLRSPVPLEGRPTPVPAEYSTPLPRILLPSEESKEIPVVPAPGIVVPK